MAWPRNKPARSSRSTVQAAKLAAVRLKIRDEPIRVGLCHCTVCRKETGGPYLAFSVFPETAVTVTGETRGWADDVVHRHFCPSCRSRLFSVEGNGEVEIRLGCLEAAPTDLAPTYENWVVHRERWLPGVRGQRRMTGIETSDIDGGRDG